MLTATQVMAEQNNISGALMEKVILGNDLSGLTSIEKVQYINGICRTLGLNPATNPIKIMKFQNKEIPYCSKDGTEQLRKNHNVSINNIETKIIEGIYIVTAQASTPDGRNDSSTGVISIKGLVGDALANAMMKAETKAKRRVTLSICGLGFASEEELETKVNLDAHRQASEHQKKLTKQIKEEKDFSQLELDFVEFMAAIHESESEEQLKTVFTEIKKTDFKSKPDLMKKLIAAKDERKMQLMISNDNVDNETGEVIK